MKTNMFLNYWDEYVKKYKDKPISDKGTQHDYINSYYADEFLNIKDADIRIVEIGIGDGYSLVLWREWFTKAEIFAIEKYPYHYFHKEPFRTTGVTSIFEDAYTETAINMFADESIDYLIDDGPHTYDSQEYCIKHWYSKIKPGGKIVVEDIQKSEYIEMLENFVKENNLNYSIRVFDSRKNKDRYDDIIIEFTKTKI